jgi:hypothetical protein
MGGGSAPALLFMNTISFLSGSKNPVDLYRDVQYKAAFRREHPEYFDPDGILVFCGPQGAGKSISAVHYVRQLAAAYPSMVIVTNMELHGFPPETKIYPYTGLESFDRYSNGYGGVVFLIDEIHLEFNSLESKDMPISILTEIAQQRKQRKHIVGTSQVFQRLAKPFREQFKYAVLCRCFFGCVQFNTLIDGAKSVEDGESILNYLDEYGDCFGHSHLKASPFFLFLRRYHKNYIIPANETRRSAGYSHT